MRGRSGHDKALPQSWRISALATRQRRLRVCMNDYPQSLLTHPALPDLSNPSTANRQAVIPRRIPV